MKSGAGTVEDTVQSNPLDWGIEVRQIKIRDVGYRMYTEGLPYLGAGIKDGSLTGGKVLLGEQSVEIDAVAVGGLGVTCRWERNNRPGHRSPNRPVASLG